MKPRLFILILIGSAALVGCQKERARVNTPWSDCEAQIQAQITNDVVGYSRTIRMDIQRADPNPTNWTAEAVVEYVNHQGGIDRTNIPYRCYQTNYWTADVRLDYNRQMNAAKAASAN
jgi:hypothetical protein